MRRWILGALVLGCGLPAVASAHDEAKTPVSGSGSPASASSASKLATWRPKALRRTTMSIRPR